MSLLCSTPTSWSLWDGRTKKRRAREGASVGGTRSKKEARNHLQLFETHLTINLCSQLLLCVREKTEKVLNYVTYKQTHGQLHRQRKSSAENTINSKRAKGNTNNEMRWLVAPFCYPPISSPSLPRNNFAYESHTTFRMHTDTYTHCSFHCIRMKFWFNQIHLWCFESSTIRAKQPHEGQTA